MQSQQQALHGYRHRDQFPTPPPDTEQATANCLMLVCTDGASLPWSLPHTNLIVYTPGEPPAFGSTSCSSVADNNSSLQTGLIWLSQWSQVKKSTEWAEVISRWPCKNKYRAWIHRLSSSNGKCNSSISWPWHITYHIQAPECHARPQRSVHVVKSPNFQITFLKFHVTARFQLQLARCWAGLSRL